MSFQTYTIDELMQLNRPHLTTALRVFQQELDGTIDLLVQQEEARKDEATLDELGNLLTLRKVFKLRLEELAELEQPAPRLVSQQYFDNELRELPS